MRLETKTCWSIAYTLVAGSIVLLWSDVRVINLNSGSSAGMCAGGLDYIADNVQRKAFAGPSPTLRARSVIIAGVTTVAVFIGNESAVALII